LPLSAVTPADRVLSEGYGNTTDRAVLLYALLNASGLEPRFILSSDLPRTDGSRLPVVSILQREAFNTLLVEVIGDRKEPVYLGDTGQYAEIGTLAHNNQPAIDLNTGKLENPRSGTGDAIETEFTINLSETGRAELTKKTTFSGIEFEPFHEQFAQFTPEERRRAHQSLLSQISQSAEAAGDMETSFDHPGHIQFAAVLPAYAVRDGDQMYFTLPEGLNGLLNLKTSRRENPFYIGKPLNRAFRYKIVIPEGWEAVLLPASSRTELPAGAGRVDVNVTARGGQIIVVQQAQLNESIIPACDYARLVAVNDGLTAPSARTILLRKK
ncbi:MAG: DUF3858 domain-containing protein, partial [Verrucomicrobia bacterium]|nr:DUF3858 domain-containing protein [Verrucomicrobiota bacterium]